MMRIEHCLPGGLADQPTPAVHLSLTYDRRCRSRQAVRLDDGREAALFLPRGTILRDGDWLEATDGTRIRVVAAAQAVLRVSAEDPLMLLRAAYHLGNRHIPVQVAVTSLQLEPDPVLHDMLVRLGVEVRAVEAPFDPEAGAYGGGHRHGHDESFADDHALAQAAFEHHHGHHQH